MGSKGGGSTPEQTSTQKDVDLLNQQSLLLTKKQQAATDKRLAEEQYQTDVAEWEAGELTKAQRAQGAARRGGGSLFEAGDQSSRPTEPDTSEFDSIMADIDKQIADIEKQRKALAEPPKAETPKTTSTTSSSSSNRDRRESGQERTERRRREREAAQSRSSDRGDPTRGRM